MRTAKLTIITLLMLVYQGVNAQQHPASFLSPGTVTVHSGFSHFTGAVRQGKILLNWTVTENQDVNMFEVERSLDGRQFTLAAVVFSSAKSSSEDYQFFEKQKQPNTSYRIRLILKNGKEEYSQVVMARTDE